MRQDYLADPATERLVPATSPDPQVIWTDLLDPTPAEEAALEGELGLDLPTRDEMRGIEPSARIYSENGIQFLTANVLAGADTPDPLMEPVTFVLTRSRVVTIRYHRPYSLSNVPQRAAGMQADCSTPIRMLMTLMEVMVDRGGTSWRRKAGGWTFSAGRFSNPQPERRGTRAASICPRSSRRSAVTES